LIERLEVSVKRCRQGPAFDDVGRHFVGHRVAAADLLRLALLEMLSSARHD
jgi:hypothetical protein